MSTESIASPSSASGAAASCARCGAPLAEDQRYCLQCGERVAPMSSVLLGAPPQVAGATPATAAGPATAPTSAAPPGSVPPGYQPADSAQAGAGRNNAVTVIAGVGVLLLAMGIGVLIGRAGNSKPSAASTAPQVISVTSAPTGAASTPTSEAASFTDDWPATSSGYAVQLQTLSLASTQPSAVEAAKTAAEGKGAKQVGALKSEDFASLPSGNYVVYAGRYAKQAEANKALAGLKKNFPDASVIHVSGGSAGGASSTAKGSTPSTPAGGKSGAGSSESNPAPPKVLEELHKSKGKNYEEKSKALPDVVGT